MNGTNPKYKNSRDIASENMCTNPDPNIYSPHWKCVCCYLQKCPPLSLPDEETNPSSFISYINHQLYKNRKMFSVHGLHKLCEQKQC